MGGKSRDSVTEHAGGLKTEGILPFAVGVRNADSRQIADISHNPSFAINVNDFSQLGNVHQKINSYVSLPKDELDIAIITGKKTN